MNDQRIVKRQRKRLPLKFGVEDASRVGFTDDISATGLFIKTSIVLNPNTVLKIELTAPTGEVILLTGRVMWAKRVPQNMLRRMKGGMGIHIIQFQGGETTFRHLCGNPVANPI